MSTRLKTLLSEPTTVSNEVTVLRAEAYISQQAQPDLQKRTLRHVIMTDGLASDGGIILPEGMALTRFLANPIVTARHGGDGNIVRPTVIGRSIALEPSAHELWSVTQFADTELGREYMYLYGLNTSGETYMRAWSIEAPIYEKSVMSVQRAKSLLGVAIDEEKLPAPVKKAGTLWVGIRSELVSYGAVNVGADRGALTRAMREGIVVAGSLLANMDLQEAKCELDSLRSETATMKQQIVKLEEDLLALRRDGAAAAARGDTAAVIREIQALRSLLPK
jgi:hypothetical protein